MDLSKGGKAPKQASRLHAKIRSFIQETGFLYDEEHRVEKYSLDFYLPEFHVGIEADGPTHYTSWGKKADISRDFIIYNASGILILRITGNQVTDESKETIVRRIVEFCDEAWFTKAERIALGYS